MTEPLDIATIVDQMALLVALPLQPEHRPGVIDNFARIAAIAQLVTEFPLSEDSEIPLRFEP